VVGKVTVVPIDCRKTPVTTYWIKLQLRYFGINNLCE